MKLLSSTVYESWRVWYDGASKKLAVDCVVEVGCKDSIIAGGKECKPIDRNWNTYSQNTIQETCNFGFSARFVLFLLNIVPAQKEVICQKW